MHIGQWLLILLLSKMTAKLDTAAKTSNNTQV
jgi:hypothetical protein